MRCAAVAVYGVYVLPTRRHPAQPVSVPILQSYVRREVYQVQVLWSKSYATYIYIYIYIYILLCYLLPGMYKADRCVTYSQTEMGASRARSRPSTTPPTGRDIPGARNIHIYIYTVVHHY